MKKFLLIFIGLAAVALSAAGTEFLFCLNKTVKDAEKASIDGTMPAGSRKITVEENKPFSFRPFTQRLYYGGTKYCGVAYTKLTFDQDCTRTVGLGAGNFFTFFVNGKKIGSTEPAGNFYRVIHPSNHIYQVKFKKGDNHLAVFLRPGADGWTFAFGIYPDFSGLPKTEYERNRLIEQLFPPAKPGLVARECIFNVSTDRAGISFETGLPSIGGIRYRKSGEKKSSIIWHSEDGIRQQSKVHRIVIPELAAGTKYDYEIVLLDARYARITTAAKGSFTTFPNKSDSTSFMLISDTQSDPEVRMRAIEKLVTMYGGKDTDFFVSLGDVSGNFNDFRNKYFTTYYDELARNKYFKPAFFVRGNHEFRGRDIVKYNQFFGRSYYAFRHGEVFFIVLETGEDKPVLWDYPGHYTMTTDMGYYFEAQRKWLGKVIESPECKSARYRVVFAHASPVSCDGKYMARNIRKVVGEYFLGDNPRCPIDLWIGGHTHAPSFYEPSTRKFYQALYTMSYDKKTKQNRAVPKKSKRKLSQDDIEKIRFPVLVNDGPGGTGVYFSGIVFKATPQNINVKLVPVVETYSTYADRTVKPPILDVTLEKGKPAKINLTTLSETR